jgi:hypothetical protein
MSYNFPIAICILGFQRSPTLGEIMDSLLRLSKMFFSEEMIDYVVSKTCVMHINREMATIFFTK